MRVLMLVTDAFGGRGGIAYYNRCLAEALAELPFIESIFILPRVVDSAAAVFPSKVFQVVSGAGSKLRWTLGLTKTLRDDFDVVFCGHLNLLPVAAVYASVRCLPLILQVHGIDAWTKPKWLRRLSLNAVDAVWSVSVLTQAKMNKWAGLSDDRYSIIPNTIRLENYGPGPKREDLVQRWGLDGKKIVLTLARLDPRERYKGIDEVMECLPALSETVPEITYLIAGQGADRARLEQRAKALGVSESVVFAGYIDEREKVDVLRLADVFAMPGSGEGFGIVYLEALACGIPTVGSCLDASQEALRQGQLGAIPDPRDPRALRHAILNALQAPKEVPVALEYFGWPHFVRRIREAIRAVTAC